ncbi:Membrane protein involved in the export of O-antigen and teichoic acid [Algibacter lectus]|uniref:oligosaccharide flippase family protein n=1 Tax=Algibacter lectus TaxID=221126 RepID=UPI0008EED31C|nr:oligosaccharide flippase family protein [Algibacter lectus]SFC34947.1 Membrane protein involved in the export of O-antigen and teichoic acid [Algibacter lectus]
MSQIKKGAFLAYINIFLTNIIGLILTPFIIKHLGQSEYGLYTLIGAFVSYISLLDFGLNNTIVRFVAKYRAQKDKTGEENFLAVTMIIYGVISVAIVIIGMVLYYNLENIFSDSLSTNELVKAKVMFLIFIFNLAISLPGGAFTAICIGYEHFVYPKTVNIVRYIIRSISVVGLLLLGGDSIGLVILDTVFNILVIIASLIYAFKKLKITFKLHSFELPLIKEIFSYSIWIFLGALIQQFQLQAGQIILGIKANTDLIAIYAIGIMLGGFLGAFSGAITNLFLPKVTKLVILEGSNDNLVFEMTRLGRLLFIMLSFILGGFLVLGKPFILLWLNENYIDSWYIALLTMFSLILPLSQGMSGLILQAKNKLKYKTLISLGCNTFGVILGYFLVDPFGIIGMAIGTATGITVSFIILNFYYKISLKLNLQYFFENILLKVLPISAIIITSMMILAKYVTILSWIEFLMYGIIYSLIFCAAIYKFVLNNYEKSLIPYITKNK